MKVHELIEWLKDFDQNADVMVVEHSYGGSYYDQGGTAYVVEFDPSVKYRFEYNPSIYGATWTYEVDTKGNATLLLGVYNG